ncbi:hypothetical protein Bca101_009981 [Brassica carinata]
MNLRDSEKVRHRAGGVGSERIRFGDVSEALTEVLREDIRFPRESSSKDGRRVEGKKAADRPSSNSPTAVPYAKDCPITEDPDSVAHLVRHFKPAGCPLPSLRNMSERDAYVKMALARAKAMEANNEFAATLEKRLKDASVTQLAAAEKLGDQTTSLEARLWVAENERKSALDQVSYLEGKIESSAARHADDLRRATYEAKKILAIMNNNLLDSGRLNCLEAKGTGFETDLDATMVSEFPVGESDLPHASEDILEDFFGKEMVDDLNRENGQGEDGEFDVED